MSRILVAHSDPLIRKDFRQIVEAEPTIEEVGEAATGMEALDHLRRSAWQLVLLALSLPDRTGHYILRHIVSRYPGVCVLMMGALPKARYARNFLRTGAKGYVSTTGAPSELLDAVRIVLGGHRYLNPSLAKAITADPNYDQRPLDYQRGNYKFSSS